MTVTTIMKIRNLVAVYEQLISLMGEANDERLTDFIESTMQSLSQVKQALSAEIDHKIARAMLKGIRQGLRETPELLATIVPEISARLMTEFEIKLGCKFSDL